MMKTLVMVTYHESERDRDLETERECVFYVETDDRTIPLGRAEVPGTTILH